MGCPVLQWQIISRSPEIVAEFYGGLFGWEVSRSNALNYRMVDTGSERGINGGIWPAPPEAPTFVQLFIEVDDVKAYMDKALARGAQVLVPPQALPDGDVMAVMLDPQGMSFGLMQGSGH